MKVGEMEHESIVRYEFVLVRRAWAAALDYILYGGMVLGYLTIFGTKDDSGSIILNGFHHLFALSFLWFLYFPVTEGLLGYTLFKGAFDLKVIAERRQDLLPVVTLKRRLLDPIDLLISFGAVGIVLAKTRSDHKRLGDMLAHSRVVLDREKVYRSPDKMWRSTEGETAE